VQPEQALLDEFAPYFDGCEDLRQFAQQHRPPHAPKHKAGLIVTWTGARSYRTFLTVIHLCACGYGQQAAMLNRTLFEDMVSAHWAVRHPDIADVRMIEHDQYTALLRAEAFDKHELKRSTNNSLPTYTDEERAKLDKRYRNGSASWTSKTIPAMVGAIAPMWEPFDRRLLNQLHDVGFRALNTLLHHSSASLSQGARITDEGVIFDVGPSQKFVAAALGFAFWTFANTYSLLVEDDALTALNELITKHRGIYSTMREVAPKP
jgi:Family of unknown function (DUF5677)